MAKQLNLSAGQVVATALHTEVQQSYLEYAMSVIVGRALPDARDGLKPVHRRILYAMHELGLTPDRPYRKCARVVGDVLGKYHPHGDQSVYDALVRLVQDFSSRYPILGGHGNFGSVDNDPPAAMRYTETRISAIGNEGLLSEIGEATVDFTPNFDSSQQEPVVLPAQLPFLLLNGSSGIAVGMATNIPPHNLSELIDGCIALIDHPNLPDDDLFAIIPGPDFPTGGEIVGTEGIREAYTTGRGSISMRGIAQLEDIPASRGRQQRQALIITELPYQVNKASWIEKIADLVNQGRIEDIQDIRDESDRDGMRVVIELKREANPQLILSKLYKMTPLQSNFGAIFLALADGQPRQMSLRELLQYFLSFRETTLTRQYEYELNKASGQIHLLEGLTNALDNLDRVIDILRNAPDGTTAKRQFQAELEFSDRQCDAILAMPLRRLTGLERQKLQTEYSELSARMGELQTLLGNRRELMKAIKKDLRSLKKKFADPRRTRLQTDAQQAEEAEALAESAHDIHEEEVVLEFTQRGYVRRHTPKTFERQQAKQESQPSQTLLESEDVALQTEAATTAQELLVLTRSGKAYTVRVDDIPQTHRQSKGTPLITLLPLSAQGNEPEVIVAQFVLVPEFLESLDLIMLTTQGRIKRVPLSEFANLTGRGLTALKLKDEDSLQYALLAAVGEQLVLATSGGRLLRFEVNDDQLPIQSRTAQGSQAIRLGKQEGLAGCVALTSADEFLLISRQGYGKSMAVKALRKANRGDLGLQAMKFATKGDTVVGIVPGYGDTNVTALTSSDRLSRIPAEAFPLQGKDGGGDRLLTLNKGETIITLLPALLSAEDEDDADP